jgi:threonine/homoserine/homoserine lactone efflux protein
MCGFVRMHKRYIPRIISLLGMFASVLWTSLYFASLVFPEKHALFLRICLPAMALAERLTGLYLTLFAVKIEFPVNEPA